MALDRTLLARGPAIVTYSGNMFYTNADILSRFGPVWNPVGTSMYGEVDRVLVDRVYKLPLRLWGAWEHLAVLFPSYAMSPQVGTSIFGSAATQLAILARNGDQTTYANAQITRLANLFLGMDSELFAADVEFTCIIGNSSGSTLFDPEDPNAYYTTATGQTYADAAFAKTNYKRVRFTGAWGSAAGFTSIIPQRGFQVSWELDVRPLTCDGLGTVDFTIGENILQSSCKCVPIQPTMAELEVQVAAQGVPFGTLLSGNVADLTLTGNGGSPVVILKNAGITEHGYAFGIEPLRQGEVTWTTTRGFTAGAPEPVASVA
jgi:hypothetical protein